MSLLSGLDDFWLFVSHRSEDRRRTYNVASLPEQFEMLHDYHQLSSKDRLADQAVHQRTRGLRAEDERGKGLEDSRFSGLYLAYKTDSSVNIPYSSAWHLAVRGK